MFCEIPLVGIEAISKVPHSKAADGSSVKYSSGVANLMRMFLANFLKRNFEHNKCRIYKYLSEHEKSFFLSFFHPAALPAASPTNMLSSRSVQFHEEERNNIVTKRTWGNTPIELLHHEIPHSSRRFTVFVVSTGYECLNRESELCAVLLLY